MQENFAVSLNSGKGNHIPVGLSPKPFDTSPLVFRSMFQVSSSPALFLRTKAKTALPCLIASLRSASDDCRAAFMSSKAAEEGNASVYH